MTSIHELKDEINFARQQLSVEREKLILFFITGNPGLIEYYRTFLTLCYDSLRSKFPPLSIQVYGTSLKGFEVGNAIIGGKDEGGPYNLEHQIVHIEEALNRVIRRQPSGTKMRVILVGHSVGSYILLEVLRRQNICLIPRGSSQTNNMKIIGGICLFPTVTHIAQSPSGQKFSLFFALPYFPLLASLIVRALFSWTPTSYLQRLVALVTGMPPPAAATTTAFLQTPGGVRQALFLAKHEMATIMEDSWDDELWGVAAGAASKQGEKEKTKLVFLFGTGDHWVKDETRDALIAARASKGVAGEEARPIMEVDGTGIPHGFCIKHNDPVAKKVLEYVEEIVRVNWQ